MEWLKKFLNGQIVPYDKMLHFFVGFFIAVVASIVLNYSLNLILITAIAFGKEYYDKKVKLSYFDQFDAYITILGGIIAIILMDFIIPHLNDV